MGVEAKEIKKIVIAGGGTAGWMAAAALSKLMGKHLNTPITLIESDQIGTVGVGEATIPTLQSFHQLLGISEENFLNFTGGTFKLGINFENWHDIGKDYFHAFGVTGKPAWACGFQHFWLRDRERGSTKLYGEHNLEMRAAMLNKFARLDDNGLKHAFHLDATKYAQFLRRFCTQFGLQREEGIIQEAILREDNGHIHALRLDNGKVIEGDLFIDCTGQRALLIGEALGVGYEDWSHWLPCDTAYAVQTESVRDPVPFTRSIAHSAGWQWQIPLQTRVGNGLVYSSMYIDDAAAKQLLIDNLPSEPITEPRYIKFQTGRRQQQWHKNCVSIGLSSGFLEPLESTSIHLIQSGILRLIKNFPLQGINPLQIDNYNDKTVFEIERIRDFIIMHYNVTDRRDTEFWRHCAAMDIPAPLQNKLATFKQTGKVVIEEGEMFGDSWAQVLIGQGLIPDQYHPIINTLSNQELDEFMLGIEQKIASQLDQLQPHKAYVDSFCAAAPDRRSKPLFT